MMRRRLLLSVAMAALTCGAALAQGVPGGGRAPGVPPIAAGIPAGSPPPVQLYPTTPAPLNAKDKTALKVGDDWKAAPTMPTPGEDGAIVFQFGEAMPSVVCAPLRVCDLALEPGEVVSDINAGDTIRWKITPAISGTGSERTTHIVIKPTMAPLETSLLITTTRRTYMVQLTADPKEWMPRVRFAYPEDAAKAWQVYQKNMADTKAATILPATGQNVAALDFNFTIDGDKPAWRPVRVYATDSQTFIQFPPTVKSGDLPALVALGRDDQDQLVNYRFKSPTMVVDKVLKRAALVLGVGSSQTKVTITRGGGAQ